MGTSLSWGRRKPPLGTRINRSHPIANGLIASWLMNEGGGPNVYDSAGAYHNKGVLSSIGGAALPTWNVGLLGKTILHNRTSYTVGSFINCGANTSLNPNNAISISCWCFGTAMGSDYQMLVTRSVGDGTGAYELRVDDSTAKVNWGLSKPTLATLVGNAALASNVWNHIVATYDGASMKIYVNGKLDNSNSSSGTIASTNEQTCIGLRSLTATGGQFPFVGKIDNVQIWNRALSYSEVNRLFVEPFCFMEQAQRRSPILILPPIGSSGSMTEANDTMAATAAVKLTATASMTEANDTMAATAAVRVTDSASISETNDTLAASSAVKVSSSAAITEANDTLSSAAQVAVASSAVITEANDTLAANAGVVISDTASITEANDTLAAAAAVRVSSSAGITEANDTLAGAGAVAVASSAAITEANDTLAAAAQVAITSSAAITEANDTLAGNTAVQVSASAAITEANDVMEAAGTVADVIDSTAAIVEADDTLAATAAVQVSNSANITEANDTLAGSAAVQISASANITEANDTLSAASEADVTVSLATTEANDTLAASAGVVVSASADIVAADDTLEASAAGEVIPPVVVPAQETAASGVTRRRTIVLREKPEQKNADWQETERQRVAELKDAVKKALRPKADSAPDGQSVIEETGIVPGNDLAKMMAGAAVESDRIARDMAREVANNNDRLLLLLLAA